MRHAVFFAIYALCCALLISPLWTGPYPPLVDLPQHAGQIQAALAWLGGSPVHRELFEFNLFTPYLGGYLIPGPLVALFGPSVGLRLGLSLGLLGIPLATSVLLHTLRAPRWWVLPAFAAAPGYAYHWGFLGFVLAAPWALLGLAVHLRFLAEPTRRRALLSTGLALACFLSHALVFGWLLVSAGLATVLHPRASWSARLTRALPLLSPVPLALVWLLRTVGGPGRTEAIVLWDPSWERVSLLPQHIAGALQPNATLTWIGIGILLSPFLLGARPARSAVGWAVLAATLGLCLLCPDGVMSATCLPWRYTLFVLPAALLCLRPPTGPLRWPPRVLGTAGALAIAVSPSLLDWRAFSRFAEQTRGFREVTAAIEPEARVAYLAFGKITPDIRGPALLHFGQWAQAERGALVDFSFAEFFPEVIRYRPGKGSGWVPGAEWQPHLHDFSTRGGGRYDYFLACSNGPVDAVVYRGAPGPGTLLARHGPFWLYSRPAVPPPLEGGRGNVIHAAAPRTPALPATEDVPAAR